MSIKKNEQFDVPQTEENLQDYLKNYLNENQKIRAIIDYDTVTHDSIEFMLSSFGHVYTAQNSMFDSTQLQIDTTVTLRATRVKDSKVVENYTASIDLAHGKISQENNIAPFNPDNGILTQGYFIDKIFPIVFKSPSIKTVDLRNNFFVTGTNPLQLYNKIFSLIDYTNNFDNPEINSKCNIFCVNDTNGDLYSYMSQSGLIGENSRMNIIDTYSTNIINAYKKSESKLYFDNIEKERFAILFRVSDSHAEYGLKFILSESKHKCRVYNPGSCVVIVKY